MSETAKTVLAISAAALSLFVAFSISPSDEVLNVDELVGLRLNQFEVDVAKRLRIVKFDSETAATREFEVAENDGLWSIPSKQDYPADAAEQMAEAATCLIDREVLRVAGKNAAEHETLGVIDPSSSKLDSKAKGVGIRVTITNSNDEALTDMIIGKPVKEAEGQYFVRNADQDVVYVVNLDPEKLSTKFEDWIEDDLLKINPLDIREVNIEDYSAEMQIMITNSGFERRVAWDRRGKFALTYDSDKSEWLPNELQKFDREQERFVDDPLSEDEELNKEVLGELRNGLDDLLLVDVERKPAGLSSDLKASSDFLNDREAIESLSSRGFIPVGRATDGSAELISSEGEIICTLKDGVEYVLRFGNLQIGDQEATSNETGAEQQETDSAEGINRYLFVMVRLNEEMIEKPALTELPELPEGVEEKSAVAVEEESEEETVTTGASQADQPVGGQSESDQTETKESTTEQTEAVEPEQPATDGVESESVESPSDADKQIDSPAEGTPSSDADELAKLIAERKSIEKENQRKLDEYQDTLKASQERVKELNERFGDWYYVISNDIYKKIHLSRDQIVKAKESEAEAENETPDGGTGGLPGLPNLPIGGGN